MQRNPVLFKICQFAYTPTKFTFFSFLAWIVEKCCSCCFSHFRNCLEGCRFSWSIPLVFMILNFHILRYFVWLLHYFRHSKILQLRNKTILIQLRFVHSFWFSFEVFNFSYFASRFLFAFWGLGFFFLIWLVIFNSNLALTKLSFLLFLQLL